MEHSLPVPTKQQQPLTAALHLDFSGFIISAVSSAVPSSRSSSLLLRHSASFHEERLSHERECRWPQVYLQAWSPTQVSPRSLQGSPLTAVLPGPVWGQDLSAGPDSGPCLLSSSPSPALAGGRSATCGAWDLQAVSTGLHPKTLVEECVLPQQRNGEIVVFKTEWEGGGKKGASGSIAREFKLCHSKSPAEGNL